MAQGRTDSARRRGRGFFFPLVAIALAIVAILSASAADVLPGMKQPRGRLAPGPLAWPVAPPEGFLAAGQSLPPPTSATLLRVGRISSYTNFSVRMADGRWKHLLLIESGWPLPALRGWQWHDASPTDPTSGHSTHWAYLTASPRPGTADAFRPHFLPLRPTWGFAVNLLLVWSVIMLPWAVAALIRRLRRRPGTCRRCRHQLLEGQERCPECGTARDDKPADIPQATSA
jgi:hypothetical protein